MIAKIPLKNVKKISLVTTNCKKTIAQVKKEQKCQYIMNCTLYNFSTLKPSCKYRVNGKTINSDKYGYWMYCWNEGKDIEMIHSNDMEKYLNGFACVSMAKDRKETILNYNKDQGGVRGRSGIGIDKYNNLIMFCSKDGTKDAMSPEKLQDYAIYVLNAQSFIMLDSGGSSSCDFNGKKITTTRKVANYICIWTEELIEENNYPTPKRTLKLNSNGEDVKWLQNQLNLKNGCSLPITGNFYILTKDEVIKFQKKIFPNNRKEWDGIVGSKTLENLNG